MEVSLTKLRVDSENDVLPAKVQARKVSRLLRFSPREQIEIAMAVSEVIRHVFLYAGGGAVEFLLNVEARPQELHIQVSHNAKRIAVGSTILEDRGQSIDGTGQSVAVARVVSDNFVINAQPGQETRIELVKYLPAGESVDDVRISEIKNELTLVSAGDPLEELRLQNLALLDLLAELRQRQGELLALKCELEDSNRGLIALHEELETSAQRLRQTDELKIRFFSNKSHEFRTPVNSILGLVRLLLDRTDGDLTTEQEKQLRLIQGAATDLSTLVNDLLDWAKITEGKETVRVSEFRLEDLFRTLRGLYRPLLTNPNVSLHFDDVVGLPALLTDQDKVSQILRNLVSNAIKFTDVGEVRISASMDPECDMVRLQVADTGIGIPLHEQERVFDEFTQAENPLQKRVRGTGLGLALSRKLAQLLGGNLSVHSTPGVGSIFTAEIRREYRPAEVAVEGPTVSLQYDPSRRPVFVVDDHMEPATLYVEHMKGTNIQVRYTGNSAETRRHIRVLKPAVIVLHLRLPDFEVWNLLSELKSSQQTCDITMYVVILDNCERAMLLDADDYYAKPIDQQRLLRKLQGISARQPVEKLLVIDPNEASRLLLKSQLAGTAFQVVEATSGREGLHLALHEGPGLILLDMIVPDMDGFEILRQLKSDPATRQIPVIVNAVKGLTTAEQIHLSKAGEVMLSRGAVSLEECVTKICTKIGTSL